MELDSRILEGKKPLTCFDVEQAKEFLGKECYFSNCKSHYKNLSAFEKYVSLTDHCIGTLTAVMDLGDRVFDVDQRCNEFRYCLPCEWVKEPEKKYRPYTMNEFKAEFKIGMVLTLRNRDTPDYVCQVMYLGNRQYDESDSNNNTIFLSQRFFSLRELFNMFEIVRNGEWQPFGVLDEQGAREAVDKAGEL